MSRQLSEMLSNSTATQGEVESEKRSQAQSDQQMLGAVPSMDPMHSGWEGLVLGAVIPILMGVSFRSFSEVYTTAVGVTMRYAPWCSSA